MSNAIKTRPRIANAFAPFGVMDARAIAQRAKKGMELVNLRELGVIPGVFGGDRGIHAAGDIVTTTADGVNLNDLWNAYQDALRFYNDLRSPLISFLSQNTTLESEPFFAAGSQANFEEATEFGEPVGYRPTQTSQFLGYTFKWWDLAARFTWMYLANAPANQVDSVAAMATEADNRNMFNLVMKTVFNNTRRTNEKGTTVYPFYSGVSGGGVGDDPPDVGAVTFSDGHNHFLTTNSATAIRAVPIENMYNTIAEHGYSVENGYNHVVLINKAQGDVIRNWRSLANGGVAASETGGGLYDFIPARGAPSFLLPVNFRTPDPGQQVPDSLGGLDVIGSYGNFTIIQNDYIPAGYLVAFATGGADSVRNPVTIREHPNASLRGLRLVKGRTPDYPLIDSFYNRGMGSGVKVRGAGAVLQVVNSASYTVPPAYVW